MARPASDQAVGVDLLEGALLPKIIRFCIPVILMHMLQTLYNAADMYVVGFSEVEGAIGAIGTTGAMTAFFINLLAGFSVGTNVLVARYIGARDQEKTKRALHTAVAVSGIFGLVSMTAGLLSARGLLVLIGDEGHILELALRYVRIYYLALPFTSLTNCFMAIFRAKGDTKTPLYVMTASGLLNVLLNFLFVLGFGMDVDGVAWATVLSNVFSAAVLMVLLMRDRSWTHFSLKDLMVSKRSFRDILVIGIPASVQSCLFALSNMLIMSSITGVNNLLCPGGSAIIDGNAAATNLEAFAAAVDWGTSQAASTFASQQLGAGKIDRVRRVRRDCVLATCILCLAFCIPLLLLQRPLILLFVDNEQAVQAAATRVTIMLSTYLLAELMDVFSAFLRGIGKSLQAAVFTLCGAVGLRVLWIVFLFPQHQTLSFIYISYPISWAITLCCHIVNSSRELRRLEARKAAGAAGSAP